MLKKFFSIISALVLLIALSTSVLAAGSVTVFSQEVNTTLDESFVVPVRLKGNTGLMGFKLTVKYPESQLTLKNVSSGELTETGLFNTTITDYYSVNGSFDVLWSNSQEVKGDGTLFMMTFETLGYADYGTYKIELSFSGDDTFNEKWQSVELECKPIAVNILDKKSASKKNEENVSQTVAVTKSSQKISDDYLIASVRAIMSSYSISDISEVTDENQKSNIVKFVNSRSKAYSPDAYQFKDFDELKVAYILAMKNVTVKNVLESVDGNKVISASGSVLNRYSAGSFAELAEKDKENAVKEALGLIENEGGDTRDFASVADSDLAAEILDGIVDGANEQENNSVPVEAEDNGTKKIIIISAAGAAVIIAAVSIAVCIKKRKKK